MAEQALIELPVTQAAFDLLVELSNEDKRSPTDTVDAILRREKDYRDVMHRMREAMERSQAEAARNGTSEMTMDEIDEEIYAMRREPAEAGKAA